MKKYVITLMIAVIIIACVGTIKFCNKDTSNIKEDTTQSIYESSEYQDIIKGATLDYSQQYDVDGNAFLVNNDTGEKIKPTVACSYIYADDILFKDDYCRFISKESGKIGFLINDGEIAIQPQYIEASKMEEGYAVVSKDKSEGYYYIDKDGGNLNDQMYEECEPFDNGIARIKYKDGRSCGLLSKSNGALIEGFDRINEFSSTTYSHITGILNGNAAIIVIDSVTDKVLGTESLEYKDISTAYFDCFAIVQDKNGNYGVIDISNPEDPFCTQEVIPTVYNKITYNVIDDTSWYGAHVKFVCTSSDKNDVIDIEF